MNPIKQTLLLIGLLVLFENARAEPIDGLRRYFTAIEKNDKELMRSAIDVPDYYKDQFVKIIDASSTLSILSELLNAKYENSAEGQRDFSSPLPILPKDILNRKFEITGNQARSLPIEKDEATVQMVRSNQKWVLDLRMGQSEKAIQAQAKLLGASLDATTALLRGFIQKIETLDTKKFTHDDAWRMVNIQIDRKLKIITQRKASREKTTVE